MPHIHIFLQELDHLYNAGDIDQYEQYWQKACQHAEHFFYQVSPLRMLNSPTQVLTGYLIAQCVMC
jgi:hypothetical protein